MTFEDFGELVDQRFDKCLDTLIRKGAGYNDTVKNERLHSFKRAAAIKGTNPVAALDGMWLKHRVSIEDELNKMAAEPSVI